MIYRKYFFCIVLILIVLSVTGCSNNINKTTNNQTDLYVEQNYEGYDEIVNLTHTLNDKQASDILNKIKEDYVIPKYGENYMFNWVYTEFNNEQFEKDNILIDIYVNTDMRLKTKQNDKENNHSEELEITTFFYRLEIENIVDNTVSNELKYNIYAIDDVDSKSKSLLSGKLNRQIVEKNINSAPNLHIHFDKSIKSLDVNQAEIIAKDIKEMYMNHFDKNVYKVENFNYEFKTEKNDDKITIDVNVYYDITLIQHPKDSPLILGMEKAISELKDKDDIEIATNTMKAWLEELMLDYNVADRNVQYLNLQIKENNNSVLEYDLFYPYVLEGETTLYPAQEYFKSIKKTAEELKQNGEEVIRREIE